MWNLEKQEYCLSIFARLSNEISLGNESYESWHDFQTPPQEVGMIRAHVGNVLKISRSIRDSPSE